MYEKSWKLLLTIPCLKKHLEIWSSVKSTLLFSCWYFGNIDKANLAFLWIKWFADKTLALSCPPVRHEESEKLAEGKLKKKMFLQINISKAKKIGTC